MTSETADESAATRPDRQSVDEGVAAASTRISAPVRHVFFSCAFVVYFFVFPYNHGLNNPNENTRIYTTIALVEHHTWRIDDEIARFGPVNDTAVINGHHYAAKAPAVSLLGVPAYWLFSKIAPRFVSPTDANAWLTAATLLLRIVVVQAPCFLFLVWFLSWLERTHHDAALCLIATAALGLGTNYLAYSLMFVSHSLSAAVAFVAFALILATRRPFLVGNLLGLVTLFDYQGAAVSVVLGLFALFSYRDRHARALFIAGASIHALVLLSFQHFAFGGAFRAPFHYLEDEHLRSGHAHGLLGLGWPRASALKALAIDRTVGFFGTSPFMWLTIAAIPLTWRNRRTRWATVLLAILFLAAAGITNWRAGWSIGPRYLVTPTPFAVLVAVAGLDRLGLRGNIWKAVARGLAGGLLLASIASVGLISILFNTLPYDISNPLMQVAIPFLRSGFVPHHAGELLGWTSPVFFSAVVAILIGAGLLAAVFDARGHMVRWPIAALACMLALAPICMTHPDCPRGVRRLTEIWEPQGRDRIGRLRAAAMDDPCLWHEVAKLERSVCWEGADDDEYRALGSECRRR